MPTLNEGHGQRLSWLLALAEAAKFACLLSHKGGNSAGNSGGWIPVSQNVCESGGLPPREP